MYEEEYMGWYLNITRWIIILNLDAGSSTRGDGLWATCMLVSKNINICYFNGLDQNLYVIYIN